MSTTAWEAKLRQWLTPPGFFLGILLGFAACCFAGRKAASFFPFRDFARFERAIAPEGMYFPTALQVRALARHEIPKDKIAVIIGGNSILRGAGQDREALWSAQLQAKLGDDYQVLNLAMNGGAPNEFGQLAAEMLLKEGRRVLYVCNCGLTKYAQYPDGTKPEYRYFFHDARARGLLLPCADRDAALAELAPQRCEKEGYDELQLQMRANRLLSFNDLWHVLAYEVGSTIWVKYVGRKWWQPRKAFPEAHVDVRSPRNEKIMQLARGVIAHSAQPSAAPADRERFDRQLRTAVPAPLRAHTLVTVNRFGPRDVAMMETTMPGVAAQLETNLRNVTAQLERCGLRALDGSARLSADDFWDHCHLLPSGGLKLADELAPAIRDLARSHGYVSE